MLVPLSIYVEVEESIHWLKPSNEKSELTRTRLKDSESNISPTHYNFLQT